MRAMQLCILQSKKRVIFNNCSELRGYVYLLGKRAENLSLSEIDVANITFAFLKKLRPYKRIMIFIKYVCITLIIE